MIDFRYHLISLVAVFLALGLGILMGSVVLDQTLVNDLETRLKSIRTANDRLHDEITSLDQQNATSREFADETEEWILPGTLTGRRIVVFEIDGTDGAVMDRIRTSVATAGGEIASTITVSENLALRSQIERDGLALALNSSSSSGPELRAELGTALGARAADVANSAGREGRASIAAGEQLQTLIDALERGDFISVDSSTPREPVPPDALFMIVGGNSDPGVFQGKRFSVELGSALAQRGEAVLLAEPSDSTWGLVLAITNDSEARNVVSTVDMAETIEGGQAIALGLREEDLGRTGHYGFGPAAASVIPAPTPPG